MNRIVLIGNGFDLAHGLESDYNSFIDWYWGNVVIKLKELQFFEDENVLIDGVHNSFVLDSVSNYRGLIDMDKISKLQFTIKNNFLSHLMRVKNLKRWVDIEEEYFQLLMSITNSDTPSNKKRERVIELNKEVENIKILLETYLLNRLEVKAMTHNASIREKIYSNLSFIDFSIDGFNEIISHYEEKLSLYTYNEEIRQYYQINPYNGIEYFIDKYCQKDLLKQKCTISQKNRLREDVERYKNDKRFYLNIFAPSNILLLSFNYTYSSKLYNDNQAWNIKSIENNIHGTLRNPFNPIIFGYGDEVGSDYSKIEELNMNEFLENVKSVRYSDSDNYKKLIEFIESDSYQIMIMGHSCGLSDRTLLNTLFEHKNCASIKPFYYVNDKGEDNYSDLIRNISRNFSDKRKMRERVVNKTYCEELLPRKK